MRREHELSTDRLELRRWDAVDLDSLHVVFAKPEVWWFPFQRGFTIDESRAFLERKLMEWEERGWSQWATIHRADDRLIGFLGLSPPAFLPEVMPTVEVGWRLDPGYWGRGLATEGGRAALEFGFGVLGLDEIVSICEPQNVASVKVIERLGLVLDRETIHPEHGVPLQVFKTTKSGREGGGRAARRVRFAG